MACRWHPQNVACTSQSPAVEKGRFQAQSCTPPIVEWGISENAAPPILCPANSLPCQLLPHSRPGVRVRVVARASEPSSSFRVTTLIAPDFERRFSVWQLINDGAEDQIFATGFNAFHDFGGTPPAGHVPFDRSEAESLAIRNGRHFVHLRLLGSVSVRPDIQDCKSHSIAQDEAPIADPWQQYGLPLATGILIVRLREAGLRRMLRPCRECALPNSDACA